MRLGLVFGLIHSNGGTPADAFLFSDNATFQFSDGTIFTFSS